MIVGNMYTLDKIKELISDIEGHYGAISYYKDDGLLDMLYDLAQLKFGVNLRLIEWKRN